MPAKLPPTPHSSCCAFARPGSTRTILPLTCRHHGCKSHKPGSPLPHPLILLRLQQAACIKPVPLCLAGIKAVKLYAWEAPFTQRILAIRRRELRCVRNSALVGLIDSASFETTPILVALAAFGTYVWQVGIAESKQCLRCRYL